MGLFANIQTTCLACQAEVLSQTKIPEDLCLQSLGEGEQICNPSDPIANTTLLLKDSCSSCQASLAISLKRGVHNGPADPKTACYEELAWGQYAPTSTPDPN